MAKGTNCFPKSFSKAEADAKKIASKLQKGTSNLTINDAFVAKKPR